MSERLFSCQRVIVFGLLAAFLLVRIAALWHFRANLNSDPDIYLALARGLVAGHGLADPGTGLPTAFRPPLYPMILAPFCQPDQGFARAVLHLGLSVLTLLALWQLGKNLHLSWRQIALAGLIFAFDPLSVRYLALPMTETFCTCLVTILLVLLSREQQNRRGLFEIGVVFGLSVLARPTFWMFAVIYGPLWLIRVWFHRRRHPEASWRIPLATFTGSLLAGIGVIVLPWLLRNLVVLHAPVLMTTHGGYTLLLGNNSAFYQEVVNQPWGTIWDGSHGPGQAAWFETVQEQAAQENVHGEVALDRWMTRMAKQQIVAHPDLFLRACVLKFCWFWNLGPQGPEAGDLPRWLLIGIQTFYGLFWLAVLWGSVRVLTIAPTATSLFREEAPSTQKLPAGGPQNPRSADRSTERTTDPITTVSWRWRLLLIFIVSLMVPHLVYWSDTRMRAPLVPALALLASIPFADLGKIRAFDGICSQKAK